MKAYGGTFICEERVHPRPPAPHITWWGWAFGVEAKTKYDELAKTFAGAERNDATLTLTFSDRADGRPTIVVSLEDVASPRDLPKCSQPLPAGAKSRAVISTMP
jgi:hypothetical protein